MTDGMVEILANGQWGTVCDDRFDMKDANVVCRILGFPGAQAVVTQGNFGRGTGKIWLDELRCYGNESSILECPHGGIGLHDCWHGEDVGVVCQDHLPGTTKRGKCRFLKHNIAIVS